MYCAFIDFEKAFDKIWREGLWSKKSSEYLLSLSLKIAVKSLPKQLTNVIGLKLLGSLLSPLFL
jgi:hypothetical protein